MVVAVIVWAAVFASTDSEVIPVSRVIVRIFPVESSARVVWEVLALAFVKFPDALVMGK